MSTQEQPRSPSLFDVLVAHRDAIMGELHVATPGRIEAYDPAKQLADVQPLLKRRVVYDSGEEGPAETLPVVPGVPVLFSRGSSFFQSFPLKRGDHVLLVFLDSSTDRFLSGQARTVLDPGDFRMHDMSDAVALAGLWPNVGALKQVHADNMVMGKDDGGAQIHITPDGKVEIKLGGSSAANSAALAEKLEALWGQLKNAYDAHTHATGTGPSGPPVTPAPGWDAAIASDLLKVGE